jgi:hypothetical protein
MARKLRPASKTVEAIRTKTVFALNSIIFTLLKFALIPELPSHQNSAIRNYCLIWGAMRQQF